MKEEQRRKQIDKSFGMVVSDSVYLLSSIGAILWVWALICMGGVALVIFQEKTFFFFFLALLAPWFMFLPKFENYKKHRAQMLLVFSIIAFLISVESFVYVFVNGAIFLFYKEVFNPKRSEKFQKIKNKIQKRIRKKNDR